MGLGFVDHSDIVHQGMMGGSKKMSVVEIALILDIFLGDRNELMFVHIW
jgi:hypothetical protein